MAAIFRTPDGSHSVAPHYTASGFDLEIDGQRVAATLHPVEGEPGAFDLEADGVRERLWLVRDGDRAFVRLRGRSLEVAAVNAIEQLRGDARARRGEAALLAPMPGVVIECHVELDETVEAGQVLLVIESMKLQTAIRAEMAGRITELPLAIGQQFEQGALLVQIVAATQEESA